MGVTYSRTNLNLCRLNFENRFFTFRAMREQHPDIHTDIHTDVHIEIFISKIVTETAGNLCKSGSVKIKFQFLDNVIKINSRFFTANHYHMAFFLECWMVVSKLLHVGWGLGHVGACRAGAGRGGAMVMRQHTA